ncbi:MAG: leucine-rich repeat protein, partial [Lachnospiraceae bacterium]|nr:leucine-rich repeat protein [Lachnospiraceae bacterium]
MMKSKLKQLTLLVFMMVVCLFPLPSINDVIAMAEEETTEIASGTCGDDLTWVLNDAGTLTISGTGDMDVWNTYSWVPWYSDRESITSIKIGDGVTSIGDWAFYKCTNVTSITIGKSVAYIGLSSFNSCLGLTSITIPDSVASIYVYAFSHCENLTSITIPDSVTSLNYYAFEHCTSLTNVSIGSGLTTIKKGAFEYCSALTNVTIPGSVTEVEESAFRYCTDLASVIVEDGVTSIGDYAFSDCESLNSVIIPDSVTSCGKYIFSGCTALTSAGPTGGSYNIELGWNDSIPKYAFYGNTNLVNMTIPDSVTSIGNEAFYECSGLTNVTIGSGVISIGTYAFYNCTGLTDITIPDNVISIEGGAFRGCSALINVTIGGNVTTIDAVAFMECTNLVSVKIPDSVTTISEKAFYSCTSLVRVILGNGVTSIDEYAFCGCESLISITIPDNVISISSRAFDSCTGLTDVIIGSGLTSVGTFAFADCTSITDVYYAGSEEGWLEINNYGGNEYLFNATIHYNVAVNIEITDNRVSVAKYMEEQGDDGEVYEEYREDYVTLAVGDQVRFSVEITTDIGTSLITATSEWSCSVENLLSFGEVSVSGPTVSEADGTKQTYSLSVTAELVAGGTCNVSFSMQGETATSNKIAIASTYNCGDDLTWSLDAAGTLTVSGTGDMYDYTFQNPAPWDSYCNNIIAVIIEDGVTSIGEYAFSGLLSNCTLTVGTGVASVGAYGFNLYGDKIYFLGEAPEFDTTAFGSSSCIMVYYDLDTDPSGWAEVVSAPYTNLLISWISSDDLSGNLSTSDIFPFTNDKKYFGENDEGYYISSSDLDTLYSQLSNTEKRSIKWYSTEGTNVYHYNEDGEGYLIREYEEWNGSCKGMTNVVALGISGLLSASVFNSSASSYSDIDNGSMPISKKTESIINFYQLQQYLPQYDDLKTDFMLKNQYTQLVILENQFDNCALSTSSGYADVVYISFKLKLEKDDGGIDKAAHSIFGYALEEGTFHVEINGEVYTFDHRVLTYDPTKSDILESDASFYYQKYSIYYYTGGGGNETLWAIPGYGIISSSNDFDINSEDDTACFTLISSDLKVINAIDYETGKLNLTRDNADVVQRTYLSAQSSGSFTIASSSGTSYVISDGQIDGTSTVADDIVILTEDSSSDDSASGDMIKVALPDLNDSYTVTTSSSSSFSMTYENVVLDVYCSSGGSNVCFEPAGKVSLVADSAGACAVSITVNEGYSSLEYPTIVVSCDNASELSVELTDDGDLLLEGDNLSDLIISGLNEDESDEITVSSDQDSLVISDDENSNLTVYEDTNQNGSYENVIAKMTGDISNCTITLSDTSYIYDGTAKTPAVTVEDGSLLLVENSDYTVSYSGNTRAGTATVTVTGIGNYTGSAEATFTINKASQTVTAGISPGTISVGETAQITAATTGDGTLSYSSGNTAVATVNSSSGLVTGAASGTAVITVTASATANYYSATKTVSITVVVPETEPTTAAPATEATDDAKETSTTTTAAADTEETSTPTTAAADTKDPATTPTTAAEPVTPGSPV